MTTPLNDPRRLIVFTVAVVVVAVAVAWALYLVRTTLLLIYVSALFAIGLAPLVRLIERQRVLPVGTRRLPRALAILIIYLAVLGVFVLLAALVLPPLVQQARELWVTLPARLDTLQDYIATFGLLDQRITLKDVIQVAPAGGADAVSALVSTLWSVLGGIFGLITLLLLTFYFLVESSSIFRAFVRLFPEARRARVSEVSAAVSTKISGWLGGQMLLALVMGGASVVGLFVMGVPYFYVLALVTAIGEMIPFIGPILAGVTATAVAFTVSPGLGVAVGVFYLALNQFENAVLVPRIMQRQVGLSAVSVIIAFVLGAQLLGFVGALLAVPTAAILQVLFQVIHPPDESPT